MNQGTTNGYVRRLLVGAVVLALLVAAAGAAALGAIGNDSSGTVSTPKPRRRRARRVYFTHCVTCHGDDFAGREQAPALAGLGFMEKWNRATVRKLFEKVEQMPPTQPKSLRDPGLRGRRRIPAERQRTPRGLDCAAKRPCGARAHRDSRTFGPNSDACWHRRPPKTRVASRRKSREEIRRAGGCRRTGGWSVGWRRSDGRRGARTRRWASRPDTGPAAPAGPGAEWRTYGADLASTRYSPLDQINKDNFKDLKSPGG